MGSAQRHINTHTYTQRHKKTYTHTHKHGHYSSTPQTRRTHTRMDCSSVCKRWDLHSANQRVPLWTVCWYALSLLHHEHCHTPPPPHTHTHTHRHRHTYMTHRPEGSLVDGVLVCPIYLLFILSIVILLLLIHVHTDTHRHRYTCMTRRHTYVDTQTH